MPEGSIALELVRGHKLKDVEFFGRSDPYAVISVHPDHGVKRYTSRTVHDGGSDPVWQENFLIEIPNGPSHLVIALFDEEKRGSDKAMGTVSINLAKLFVERQIPRTKYSVQLSSGKFHGELEVGLKFFPKVHRGILVVHLLEAHGLPDTDTFGKSDPYALIECHKKVQRSRVVEGAGSAPFWDETFEFQVESDVTELLIKLFDKDNFKADDDLGTVKIPLQQVFLDGHVPPLWHKVLGKLGQPQGELRVGLKFEPKPVIAVAGVPPPNLPKS